MKHNDDKWSAWANRSPSINLQNTQGFLQKANTGWRQQKRYKVLQQLFQVWSAFDLKLKLSETQVERRVTVFEPQFNKAAETLDDHKEEAEVEGARGEVAHTQYYAIKPPLEHDILTLHSTSKQIH